jgi:tetratricopeptide (TPR) repeat protein
MFAYYGIGLLSLRQGDLPSALLCLEQAVSVCREVDLRIYFPWLAVALGAAYALDRRITDAVLLLTEVMEQSAGMKIIHPEALCCLSLGEAQMLAGRLEEAQALAKRALSLARHRQERGHEAYALCLLGDIAAQRKPPESTQAEAYYRQSLTLTNGLGMRPLQAHCHRGLGTLYRQTGQPEQALAELSTAIEMYRDMEMTFWLPETEAALAAVGGKA